jgi:hypothetical protein
VIASPAKVSYRQLLRGNCIGCLTAIYDTEKVGKLYFQNIGHEDYVYWLTILQKGFIAQNTNTVEALYRINNNSVSANKFIAARWTWNIYHQFLKFSFWKSLYYFCFYLVKAYRKYIR